MTPRALSKLAVSTAMLLAGTLPAGCLVIPVPAKDVSAHGLESAAKNRPSPVASFEVGRTRRREVLLTLGPPERSWKCDRFMVYLSDTVDTYLIVIAGGYYAGGATSIDLGYRYSLFLEFDEAGLLRRKSITRGGLNTPAGAFDTLMDAFERGEPLPEQ